MAQLMVYTFSMNLIACIAKQIAPGELGITSLFENCLKQDQLRVKLFPGMDGCLTQLLCSGYKANA